MTTVADTATHRFTRAEYEQMADMGFFVDERVELIGGEILDMSPQSNPHSLAIMIMNRILTKHLGEEFLIRCQMPMAISEEDEPEPDFAVLRGRLEDLKSHPSTALWVAEVAFDSLARDRKKIALYAQAGVQEYWIINLKNREIMQHTQPNGSAYAATRVLAANETITSAILPLPARAVEQYLSPS